MDDDKKRKMPWEVCDEYDQLRAEQIEDRRRHENAIQDMRDESGVTARERR
jgi:hypothetical protein